MDKKNNCNGREELVNSTSTENDDTLSAILTLSDLRISGFRVEGSSGLGL